MVSAMYSFGARSRLAFYSSCASTKTIIEAVYGADNYKSITSYCNDMFSRLASGNRSTLSQAITLVESQNLQKRLAAQLLLNMIKKTPGKSTLRIGISGPPGAGKSTFIEAFGTLVTEKFKRRLAVLAVDPSSILTDISQEEIVGGSILGDKTRMMHLARNKNAFIRPSPSCGTVGGVSRNTAESIVMCEAAGFDLILVETMGVGQAEFVVTKMVDLFCLLVAPAAGDELQGLKKGIVEEANIIVVNKFDGDLLPSARRSAMEYISALKLSRQKLPFWRPRVQLVSSVPPYYGLNELWDSMMEFESKSRATGFLNQRRSVQFERQMWFLIQERLFQCFMKNGKVMDVLPDVTAAVKQQKLEPGLAADYLLHVLNKNQPS